MELAALLLVGAGAFEVGVEMRRLLVGLILCALAIVIVSLVIIAIERRRAKQTKEL